ncbi:Serine/threonine protein kinase [hydrothermal vent metagenome]|uniref:Serine/threonine protein kinase n=1 Tax=hydrothermal vent metagenome TaxID=652676 RepID=A0A3B1D3H6_9ZZZZ
MSSDSINNRSAQTSSETKSLRKKTQAVKVLGKYQIQKKIGSGGMGTVFLAEHTELKRIVALKVLPVSKAENPTLVKRFKAEARAAANLKHENIVAVYEAGEAAGRFYIALEYIDGKDVLQILRKEGVMSVKRSVDIVKQTAQALQHAFEQNIVHRDIKPSNLLIDSKGVLKLTDMGLARTMDESAQTQITRDGTTVGTVDYMSPEQARDSKAADIRSDLYSLGCTWYQMLTLKVPFGEGSMTNKLNAHATQSPPDPRAINDKIPEAMVAVIHRMLAKKPDDRYQTPQEFIDDLAKVPLKQRNVSNDVLSGLAGQQSNKKKRKQLSNSGATALPPKTKATHSSNPEEKNPSLRVSPFKFAFMGVLAAGILIGLYWLTTFLGSIKSTPAEPLGGKRPIFDKQEKLGKLPNKIDLDNKQQGKFAPPISRRKPISPKPKTTKPTKTEAPQTNLKPKKAPAKPGF